MNFAQLILEAEQQIRPYVLETPLEYSIPLSKMSGAEVYLKCEHLQHTGAFKVRGAFNKILSLTSAETAKGIVTASSGNHGAAVAYALHTLHLQGRVFVPTNVSSAKADNIKQYEAALEYVGEDTLHTEDYARAYATQHHQVYISPYNDLQIICGQGTIGLEIFKQLPKIEVILVPIGGGGLISGIGAYIKSVAPQVQVIGCLPENSPVMAESIAQGKIIEMQTYPTLSDATAGGIESESLTFGLCQQFVDEYLLVSEEEIRHAIVTFIKVKHQLIEGAAALTLAALLKYPQHFENKRTALVLSGGNISLDTLKTILCQ